MHIPMLLAAIGTVQGVLLLVLVVLRRRHRCTVPIGLLAIMLSIVLGIVALRFDSGSNAAPWLFAFVTPMVWWYVHERVLRRAPSLMPIHLAVSTIQIGAVIGAVLGVSVPARWVSILGVLVLVVGVAYGVTAFRIVFGNGSTTIDHEGRVRCRAFVLFAVLVLACGGVLLLGGGSERTLMILIGATAAYVYTVSAFALLVRETVEPRHGHLRTHAVETIPEDQVQWIAGAVRTALAVGEYRDAEFSLHGLAHEMGVHPNRLSAVVNDGYHESFPSLVTRYRLDYFVRRVTEGALETLSILDLAMEAGFPSKSTFNRAFKRRYGVSPSEYLDRCMVSNR